MKRRALVNHAFAIRLDAKPESDRPLNLAGGPDAAVKRGPVPTKPRRAERRGFGCRQANRPGRIAERGGVRLHPRDFRSAERVGQRDRSRKVIRRVGAVIEQIGGRAKRAQAEVTVVDQHGRRREDHRAVTQQRVERGAVRVAEWAGVGGIGRSDRDVVRQRDRTRIGVGGERPGRGGGNRARNAVLIARFGVNFRRGIVNDVIGLSCRRWPCWPQSESQPATDSRSRGTHERNKR